MTDYSTTAARLLPTGPGSASPVAPTAAAISALHPLPLSAVSLAADGYLGAWQALNATATLPHCIANLDSSGALGNLRHAAGRAEQPFTGMRFADSDVYKTLEAANWQLGRDPDEAALRTFVDEAAALLEAAQESDGYLNSWVQLVQQGRRWQDLKWGHELYCAGHLIQAGVAAERSGASPALVAVAYRFADLIADTFGPAGREGICGHPEIETALVELFRVSDERRYLELASRMIELRGHGLLDRLGGESTVRLDFGSRYFLDHAPVREATAATGHAVRQLYLESGVVDVAVESGDTTLLAASERLWDDLFDTKTYVSGAHGSRHRDESIGDAYELPSDRAYAETCAAIASFQWNWRLLLATGRHRYADEMERTLYNAIAVSTALDGKHFFYSNPLQLRPDHDGVDTEASRRLSWFRCACCPPNLARLIASLSGYVATTNTQGVQLHLYSTGAVRAELPGGGTTLNVRTGYPWSGRIDIEVATVDVDAAWTLALRVPGWCSAVEVSIDGEPAEPEIGSGYLQLRRVWRPGTSVVLELGMPPRVIEAHPRVDAVRGCVALARGPLIYCLEQADLDSGIALDDVCLDGSSAIAVERDDIVGVPVALSASGTVSAQHGNVLYPEHGESRRKAGHPRLSLLAVPYFRWANRSPGAMRVWIPT